jgi:hypothetical protein
MALESRQFLRGYSESHPYWSCRIRSFGIGHYRSFATWLMPTALQTNRCCPRPGGDRRTARAIRRCPTTVGAGAVVCRGHRRSERQLFETLTTGLSDDQRHELDTLLKLRSGSKSAPLHGCVRLQAHQPAKISCFISSGYSIVAISNCAQILLSSSITTDYCSSPAKEWPQPRSISPASTIHAFTELSLRFCSKQAPP